ncbi:transcription factor HY5-like, partial [Phalaenopsis equestris]
MQGAATSSLPSSSEISSSSAPQMEVRDDESDEEMRRVPEVGYEQAFPSISDRMTDGGITTCSLSSVVFPTQRKRGNSPADKEKHLK